jgi:phage FluMu gp28-like protein
MTKAASPLDLLLPYQQAWYRDQNRFKCGIWSRQTGKDFTCAAEIVSDCLQRRATTWMIVAPSERQSFETLLKCKEWSEAFKFAIASETEERDAPGALVKSAQITFANSSRIIAVPGRPDTVRGFSANVLMTEFAFFDDPEATWRAVFPSITNPLRGGQKRLLVISTPNGKGGRGRRFFKIVDENLLNPEPGKTSRWTVHRVTIEDAIRAGLPQNADELREAVDDPEAWAQEYMCEFLDTSNVLLPYDLIASAETIDATETADPEIFTPGSGRAFYCGIDFGRTHDPAVCWTLEQVGPLLITREVLVLRGIDSPTQQELLRARIKAARLVSFDYTGPGIGLGDFLAQEHGQFKPSDHQFGKVELCTFTRNFKRLIFPRLRRCFESPVSVRIPVSVDIREDLHAMQQIVSNGEYDYRAPRTAEGHSDRCTALALAVRAAQELASGPVEIIAAPISNLSTFFSPRFKHSGNRRLA